MKRADPEIQDDIENAIFFNPATESYKIAVKVDKGDATQTGKVESWPEKMLAAKIAQSVRGVVAIHYDIEREPKERQPDPTIMALIETALKWKVFIGPRN